MSNPIKEQSPSLDPEFNLEVIERDNLKRLTKYVPDDFSLEKAAAKIGAGTKKQKKFDRRSKRYLYEAIADGYLIMLAAEKSADVKAAIFSACKEEGVVFRDSTSLSHRVIRLFMTDDSARVSEYAKAMRGAVVARFSPDELREQLLSGEETIESLGDRMNQKGASQKAIKLVLSESARKRYQSLTRRRRMLAVVTADPDERSLRVRLLTVKKQRAVGAFSKKKSSK